MLIGFSQRLLALLQFTRMALVFTAISDSTTGYILDRAHSVPAGGSLPASLRPLELFLVALISIGLYGFGMTLNDIIDRRRDSMLAAHRPLPSGRMRLATAHFICFGLAALAIGCAFVYGRLVPGGWQSWVMVMFVGALITSYDFAGKYLVGPGLLTLGLIRMFHCLIAAPDWPCIWHPLMLFTHVTILSAVAYAWEQKRPSLTPIHWLGVATGVVLVDVMSIALLAGRARPQRLWIQPGLMLLPVLMSLFLATAVCIRYRTGSLREAGQRLMLAGLLWLILYDAAIVLTYAGWACALAILGLLPLSYLMVLMMRWWSRLLAITQPPEYKRVRSDPQDIA
ncbi:MAG: UbiA family prenyltransferase [Tepidisphaeraceae bacterium]|jgi:4-hydroxybenzoate polyprenyltransferase